MLQVLVSDLHHEARGRDVRLAPAGLLAALAARGALPARRGRASAGGDHPRLLAQPGITLHNAHYRPALALGDLWAIGGEIVYRAFLPHADLVVRTRLDPHVPGDTYPPGLGGWTVATSTGWQTSPTGIRYIVEELRA